MTALNKYKNCHSERSEESISPVLSILEILREACPERLEILRYAQNDRKRGAQNDQKGAFSKLSLYTQRLDKFSDGF